MIGELIKNRRATPPRFIDKKEVAGETIVQLLENANWAPTHKQTEPWRFKVYTGEARLKLADKISSRLFEKIQNGESINPEKVKKLKENLGRVPVVIAIIMERDAAERIPEWQEIAAVSMAVQNMWLAATEMGMGAFWATPEFIPSLSDIVQLKPRQKLLGFFYVGYLSMSYPSPGRGPVEDKVEWG